MREFPVDPLPRAQIVDTNGAGDSFVGAFLAALVQGGSIDECVRAGCFLSREVVQRSGCTFPEQNEFIFRFI